MESCEVGAPVVSYSPDCEDCLLVVGRSRIVLLGARGSTPWRESRVCSDSCVIRVGARTDVPSHSLGDVRLSKVPLTSWLCNAVCNNLGYVNPREIDCAHTRFVVECSDELALDRNRSDIAGGTGKVNAGKAE